MSDPLPIDPLAPDAPLLALIKDNSGFLATASDEQLRVAVQRYRTLTSQPVSLAAELNKESKPREKSKLAQLKAKLADI